MFAPIPCAAEKEEELPRQRFSKRAEISDEDTEQILSRLSETNPEKAEELKKLQNENPEKFKSELRKAIRSEFGGGGFGRANSRGQQGERGDGRGAAGFGRGEHTRGLMRERMREVYNEYLEWLGKEYPDEAKKLEELKRDDPELYARRIGVSYKKYKRIFEASENNPKLAAVLKEDMKLRAEVTRLCEEIEKTDDEDKKKLLTEELATVVSKRFDVILQRKQIEYGKLLEKLEALKKRIKESEAELSRRKESKYKEENVKVRVEELLSSAKRFKWD